ncbi:MAG TPA: DUF6249 domain-containing protein [Thermoanaerobaculia bacterium]|nr:DUF6249 domain-containing protein [Thermoanaerobaculia bacterium]
MESFVATVLVFSIPLAAVIGSILAVILRTRGQQRLTELAYRERLAAIERGLDLSQLPPLLPTPRQSTARREQGMFIGGLLTAAIGIGLSLTLLLLPPGQGHDAWSIGFVPLCIGIALMVSAKHFGRRGLDT